MHNIHAVTFNLHSICMQLYLVVIFQISVDAENYSAFKNLLNYLDVKKNEGRKLQPTSQHSPRSFG